jgi:GTPase SAR1 family protein
LYKVEYQVKSLLVRFFFLIFSNYQIAKAKIKMGLFDMISAAFGWSRKEARILVIGLDNSGKTTLINHIKPKKVTACQRVTSLHCITLIPLFV